MPGFPWLTALVPLAMAAAVWFTTRSTLLVAFMAFSFVYVLASAIESRRESCAADRFAVAEFLERAASADREMEKLARSACHRDEQTHPAATEALGWCRPVSHRLWERSGLHPAPLVVRVGHALLPRDDTVRGVDHVRADLRGEMDRLRAHGAETERPLVVDLALTGGLALIGDAPTVGPLADAVVAQLAALVPPGSLAVELPETERWDWARWLPHATSPGDHLLRVSPQEGDRRPPARRLAAGSSGCGLPAPTLWVAPDAVGLPEEIRAVVQVDNHGVATLQVDHDPPREFTAEVVKPQECEDAARALAGLDAGRAGTAPSLDSEVSLESLGLLPDPRRILEAWGLADPGAEPPLCERFTRGRRALMVELGLVAGGGSLSVDLVRDGPHVLVAGTTGSGKSELLRTMLLGLAARYPPGRVTMYLVDYKGGAAFGPLTDLPHCVGLMTDLRADGTARTLEALRAELRRREILVERHGANDLDGLDPGAAPPSLLLVVDEFATLVAEAPEFLEGVLDVAQRGRSLGIHLVLATQRPAGVVSDSIRANTNLRIALRLPDAHDSEDVVGSPAAAGLSRDLPGLALVRLGPTNWSGSGLPAPVAKETQRRGYVSVASRHEVRQESGAAPAPGEPIEAGTCWFPDRDRGPDRCRRAGPCRHGAGSPEGSGPTSPARGAPPPRAAPARRRDGGGPPRPPRPAAPRSNGDPHRGQGWRTGAGNHLQRRDERTGSARGGRRRTRRLDHPRDRRRGRCIHRAGGRPRVRGGAGIGPRRSAPVARPGRR
ncbi:MAG: FtsK/SpoIIIE domain-containing protein [Microthrixaceae bacterium]